jgi:plastocyanin
MKSPVTTHLGVLVGLVVFAALGAGCGDDSNPTGGGGGTRPHFKTVSMSGSNFSPSSLTIAVGDTVRWTNFDNVTHSVTSDAGSELDSPNMGNAQIYQHIFMSAGSNPYHCKFHVGMNGTVTVQ